MTIKSSAANMPKITALLATAAGQTDVLKGPYRPSFTAVPGSAVFYVPPAPAGDKTYAVKLSFSGSAPPTDNALTAFKTAIAEKMAATLFGGKIRSTDIFVSVSKGRRRLLAFTVSSLSYPN